MRKRIKKILLLAIIAIFATASQGYAGPYKNSRVKVDVWMEHGFDSPFCSDDELEVFIRPRRDAYITVMVIDPHGYANVIYPERPRRQRKLWGGEVYRLSRLLHDDSPLYFYGLEGTAYISVIATRRPVFLNDWLLDEISDFCYDFRYDRPGFHVGIGNRRLRLDVSWNNHLLRFGYNAFTRPIILQRNVYIGRPHHHNYKRKYHWNDRWSYRSRRPVIIYEQKDRDDRYYSRKTYPKKWDKRNEQKRRDYDRRERRDRDDAYGLQKGKSRESDQKRPIYNKNEKRRSEDKRRDIKSESRKESNRSAVSRKTVRRDESKSRPKAKSSKSKMTVKKSRDSSKSKSSDSAKRREKKNE